MDYIYSLMPQFMETALDNDEIAASLIKLKDRGWSISDVKGYRILLAGEVDVLMTAGLKNTVIEKWFQYLDKTMNYSRFFHFSVLADKLLKTEPELASGMRKTTFIQPYEMVMGMWWDCELIEMRPFHLDSKSLKQKGDAHASLKEYKEALINYGILNVLGIDSPDLIQSLTNAAALRLRLSDEEPRHLSVAILECTLALQIDPNHVKALFRRGLALALCKKWNQAIVDFERALELDPLSTAKKELEVARRQVTRRIGN